MGSEVGKLSDLTWGGWGIKCNATLEALLAKPRFLDLNNRLPFFVLLLKSLHLLFLRGFFYAAETPCRRTRFSASKEIKGFKIRPKFSAWIFSFSF